MYFYFYETKQSFINPRTLTKVHFLLLTLAQFTPPTVRGTTTLLGNVILSRFIDKNEQISRLCLVYTHCYHKLKFLCHAVFACGGNFLPWYLHFCSLVHLPHPTTEPESCVYNCLPAPMTAVVETLAETGKVQSIPFSCCSSYSIGGHEVTHEKTVMWEVWLVTKIREEYYAGSDNQSASWGSTGQWAVLLGSTSQVIRCRIIYSKTYL